jgi:hypothetical protein
MMLETGAKCKAGIHYSYKGVGGYHPLLLTLAGAVELLRLQKARSAHNCAKTFSC